MSRSRMAGVAGAVIAVLLATPAASAQEQDEQKFGIVASPQRQVVEADVAEGNMLISNVGTEEITVHGVVFGYVPQEEIWTQQPGALEVEDLVLPPGDTQRAWFKVLGGRETPCRLYRVAWEFPTGVQVDTVGTLLNGSVSTEVVVKGTTSTDLECQQVVGASMNMPPIEPPKPVNLWLLGGIAAGFTLTVSGLAFFGGRRRGRKTQKPTYHGFG